MTTSQRRKAVRAELRRLRRKLSSKAARWDDYLAMRLESDIRNCQTQLSHLADPSDSSAIT